MKILEDEIVLKIYNYFLGYDFENINDLDEFDYDEICDIILFDKINPDMYDNLWFLYLKLERKLKFNKLK